MLEPVGLCLPNCLLYLSGCSTLLDMDEVRTWLIYLPADPLGLTTEPVCHDLFGAYGVRSFMLAFVVVTTALYSTLSTSDLFICFGVLLKPLVYYSVAESLMYLSAIVALPRVLITFLAY